MQSIIFITLSVIIMGFVLFLGVKAIQKGLNAKNNKLCVVHPCHGQYRNLESIEWFCC